MTFILMLLGFGFLIKGADWLVDGSSSIAKKFKISDLVIGLTIVAFGTSAPELFVNLYAAYTNSTDIAIGNVIGSNIANVLFILGLSAVIYPLKVSKGTVWKEIPLSLLAGVLILIMSNDRFLNNANFNALVRAEGLVLLAFFIIFLYYIVGIAKIGVNTEENTSKIHPMKTASLMVLGGLVGLVVGGRWIVDGAIEVSKLLGISDSLIALTVVAIGTSLPEMATSAMAAYKKNADIAVGNVVGSNIFNIFWILGVSAVINPLPLNNFLNFDLAINCLASGLLFIFMFLGKKHTLERWQGWGFLSVYVIYMIKIITRG